MTSKDMDSMNLSGYQSNVLEENFKKVRHPAGTELMLIAAEAGLSEEETKDKMWKPSLLPGAQMVQPT